MTLTEDELLPGCIDCGNLKIENEGRCASCAARRRKEAEQEKKRALKKPAFLQRGGPINKMSEKRKEESKEYSELRADYLEAHPKCEANLRTCTGIATEIHHKAKRGKNYLNVETFMATCRNCHVLIEQFMSAEERREYGFLINVKEKPTI